MEKGGKGASLFSKGGMFWIGHFPSFFFLFYPVYKVLFFLLFFTFVYLLLSCWGLNFLLDWFIGSTCTNTGLSFESFDPWDCCSVDAGSLLGNSVFFSVFRYEMVYLILFFLCVEMDVEVTPFFLLIKFRERG